MLQGRLVSDWNMVPPVQQVLELENEMAKLTENLSVSRHVANITPLHLCC